MESEFNGLLTLLTFFPLVGVFLLLVWRNASDKNIKWTAIITSTITLILSVVIDIYINYCPGRVVQLARMHGSHP